MRERLTRLGGRLRRRVAFLGVARALVVVVGMLVLGLVLDRWLELGRPGRVLFWLVTLAAAAYWLYRHAVRPWLVRLTPVDVAAAWDRANVAASGSSAGPGPVKGLNPVPLAPRVATVLEMPSQLAGPHGASAGLVERAVRASHAAVAEADLGAGLDPRPVRQAAGLLAAAVTVPLLIAVIWPATAGLWAERWFTLSNEPWPRNTALAVQGLDGEGRLIVPRGEPFEVRVGVTDKEEPTETVHLTLEPKGGADTEARQATLESYAPGAFRRTLAPIDGDAALTVSGGDATLGPVPVRVVDRPRVTGLTLTTSHERHPNEPPTVHELTGERGDVSLLPGTRATLRLGANVPVARLRASAGELPGEVKRLDGRSFEVSWTQDRTVRFDVELVAAETGLVSYPLPVTVRLRSDQAPTLTLTPTGVRQRITPHAVVPLDLTARDDHGLQRVTLDAALTASAPPADAPETPPKDEPLPTLTLFEAAAGQPTEKTALTLHHDFDLQEREAKPGDVLRLTATATDDGYAGVQETPSRTLTFRVVTRDELFREVLLRQQGLRQQFRQAATEAQAIADALTLAESPAVGGGVRGRFAAVQRQVWSVSLGLDDTAAEMRLNRLAGEEAFELMKGNVLDPLTTLHDESLAAQRRRIEALAGPAATADELVTARQEQAALVATMENILRQMDQFDSFIDVVNQLNEVLNLQRGVLNSTRVMSEEKRDELFDD